MKLISQLLAISLPPADSLQIMAALATVFISVKKSATKLSESMSRKAAKKSMRLEKDMWAIE